MKKKQTGNHLLMSLIVAFAILLFMLVFAFFSLLLYKNRLNQSLGMITKRNMEQYSDQSVLLFRSMMDDSYQKLETIAQFCSMNGGGAGGKAVLELLNQNTFASDLVQYGVCGSDGRLYRGDGTVIDVSEQSYFLESMDGQTRSASDVITLVRDQQDVIILAVPIFKDGSAVGMVCSQYDVQYFTDFLGDSQFKGTGATMVIQADGRVVSGYPGTENFATLFDALEPMEFSGADTLDSFKRHIANGDSGFFTYYKNDRARYLYFCPTGFKDYTLISLVMAESLDSDYIRISRQAMILVLKTIFSYSVILICIWAISVLIHKLIRYYQKDLLTQTYNKICAQKEIEHYLKRSGRRKKHALLFLDIDNFKSLNDQYGHKMGDTVLIRLGTILNQNFRPTDIISRFGGDEFLIFMKNISCEEDAGNKARRLCALLKDEWSSYSITVSVGIACFPSDAENYRELLEHADEALYHAKKQGKNQFHCYKKGLS